MKKHTFTLGYTLALALLLSIFYLSTLATSLPGQSFPHNLTLDLSRTSGFVFSWWHLLLSALLVGLIAFCEHDHARATCIASRFMLGSLLLALPYVFIFFLAIHCILNFIANLGGVDILMQINKALGLAKTAPLDDLVYALLGVLFYKYARVIMAYRHSGQPEATMTQESSNKP
jgi:hypothetical protein